MNRVRINIKGSLNGFGGSGNRMSTPAIATLAKLVMPFAATATPSLSDYQDLYAPLYGEHPSLVLKTIDDDGNYIQRSEQAKYTMSAGLIDTISWDFPDAETGFIIIS
jgi:hypothetical protein